jgi:hypothetical protein
MATIPTSIGPIAARQINHSLYVGQSDLTMIQSAVTVAARIGGFFTVVIPFDYTGGDSVATVTGGNASIEIIDQRGYQSQTYTWSGTQYTPQMFLQDSGFISMGKPASIPPASAAFYFDPTGTAGVGTAHIDFFANPGMGMPSLNFAGHPSDGTDPITFMRLQNSTAGFTPAGIPQLDAQVQLGLFNEGFDSFNLWVGGGYITGSQGMTIWAKAAENAIDFQGQTIGGAYDQAIRLNYLGGPIRLGTNIVVNSGGNVLGISSMSAVNVMVSGFVAASDMEAQTCVVDNSPVRTFANTPDGPGQGMVWPPIGIAVSAGDHWQDPSIDPASLATWPTAGYAVSTGTTWAASIAPTLVPLRNQVNAFTLPQQFAAGLGPIFGGVPAADYGGNGLYLGWDNNGTGGSDFICQPGTGIAGFNWWAATSAGVLSNLMGLDHSGNLTVPGSLNATTQINVAATTTHLILDTVITAHPNSRFGSLNLASTALRGGFQFDGYSSDFSQAASYLIMWQDAQGVHSQFPVGDVTMNAGLGITGSSGVSGASRLNLSGVSGVGFLDAFGVSTTLLGSITFRGMHSDGTALTNYLTLAAAATFYTPVHTPSVDAFGGVNPGPLDANGHVIIGQGGEGSPSIWMVRGGGTANQHIWSNISWDGSLRFSARSDDLSTTDYVWLNVIRTGATVTSVGFSATNFSINLIGGGAFTVIGGSKNFAVPDPIDDEMMLIHSCLEGPEIGVFYRGEGVTAGGWAEITLPEYFEALTFPEDRSVLLTALFEEEDEPISSLAASRVKDGKFKVWSGVPTQKFYWEVKAVRRIGVDRLKVHEPVPNREDLMAPPKTQEEANARRANRSGTPEDGELQPADSHTATADAADDKRAAITRPKRRT